MVKLERELNALMVIILCGILLGAFGVQFFMHEQPCPLCMLQRLGMIGVATGGLLNLWFGIRMSHYGLCLFGALTGGVVALRQISLHVCPNFPQYGIPVLGLSLYTWSFLVFVCVVLAVAFLLFLYNPKESEVVPPSQNLLSYIAFGLIFSITFVNIVTTFLKCGFGPCAD